MSPQPKTNDSSDLEDWDNYMDAKKSKLQEQFMSEARETEVKKDIFKGTSIFVNGYTVPTADELRFLMMEYGGIYHHYYSAGKTKYMIASNLPNVKVKQYKNSSVKILKPSWVSDCIEAGKMLDYRPYLLLSEYAKIECKIPYKRKSEDLTEETVAMPGENTLLECDPTSSISPLKQHNQQNSEGPSNTSNARKTARDENFLEEFYNNSRLHHISTMGATFKQYINELRSKSIKEFPGRERLKRWKLGKTTEGGDFVQHESCIMHIDMDCFFVSVGLKKCPHLKLHPVVVTHAKGNKTKTANLDARKSEFSLYEKRNKEKYENTDYKPWYADISESDSMAEIASCSYEARKFGIKNGMLLGQAFKLCPNLKPIPYDFDAYTGVSFALYNHVASYTLNIEAVSCDEMYVDCSELLTYANVDALEFATFLREEIKEITGCPCSTGFGSNRLLARLATKKAKPDGQYLVKSSNAGEFIQELDVSDLPGVGHAITTKLRNIGVKTCKDLQNVALSQLQQEFGMKFGLTLHKYSLGEDDRGLNFCHKRKSVSAEVNYGIRFETSLDVETFLKKLCKEVESRLNQIGCRGKSITLKLMLKDEEAPTETAKYLGHGVCNNVTKTVSLLEATSECHMIYREILKMIQNLKISPSDMRGIGIQVSRLEEKKNVSTSSGKMDKFVVKSKREDRPKNVSNVPEETKTSHQNAKQFDESEYDVSLSQVDPNYFEALPSDIKDELISGLKKKRHRYSMKNHFSLDDVSPSHFIIKENGSPALNPQIPAAEISKAIASWIQTERCPQKCDIKMLSDYLQKLILNKEFESVNFIFGNFQRYINSSESPEEWKQACQRMNEIIKETVRSNCSI